jgi:hypothetical protein
VIQCSSFLLFPLEAFSSLTLLHVTDPPTVSNARASPDRHTANRKSTKATAMNVCAVEDVNICGRGGVLDRATDCRDGERVKWRDMYVPKVDIKRVDLSSERW